MKNAIVAVLSITVGLGMVGLGALSCEGANPPGSLAPSGPAATQLPTTVPDGIGMDYSSLLDRLRGQQGVTAKPGGDVSQPFFPVEGKLIHINEEDAQVFEFANSEAAREQAVQVAPSGASVGTSSINWVAPPHFYSQGKLIVLYVGDDAAILQALEAILDHQFAGFQTVYTRPDFPAEVLAFRDLAIRLEVSAKELKLVAAEPKDWPDTSLGCPKPGMFYAQVITPGYRFVFSHGDNRYEYHTNLDGSAVVACP